MKFVSAAWPRAALWIPSTKRLAAEIEPGIPDTPRIHSLVLLNTISGANFEQLVGCSRTSRCPIPTARESECVGGLEYDSMRRLTAWTGSEVTCGELRASELRGGAQSGQKLTTYKNEGAPSCDYYIRRKVRIRHLGFREHNLKPLWKWSVNGDISMSTVLGSSLTLGHPKTQPSLSITLATGWCRG
jgi:hypothetical protein